MDPTQASQAVQFVERPSVLSFSITEKMALYSAYMPFLKHGGIFVPTNKTYALGDEVYLMLGILDDPNKYPVVGTVAWITPSTVGNNKSQGVGIHFSEDENGVRIKQRIEEILGSTVHSTQMTQTL